MGRLARTGVRATALYGSATEPVQKPGLGLTVTIGWRRPACAGWWSGAGTHTAGPLRWPGQGAAPDEGPAGTRAPQPGDALG